MLARYITTATTKILTLVSTQDAFNLLSTHALYLDASKNSITFQGNMQASLLSVSTCLYEVESTMPVLRFAVENIRNIKTFLEAFHSHNLFPLSVN